MNKKTHFTKDSFGNRIYFSLIELAQARDTEDVSVMQSTVTKQA